MADLTLAQKQALKAHILADPVLAPKASGATTDLNGLKDAMNALASPTFTVWKSNTSITETGKQFVGSEWAGMTSANHTRLQTIAQWLSNGYNPSLADIRAMFDDVWSGAGGTGTRARLLAFWKRPALRIEKLFATGTGSDASPATLVIEGQVTLEDISLALVS